MVEKLQHRLIMIATLSVIVMLLLVLGVINIISSVRNNRETGLLLEYIAENDGDIPSFMGLYRGEGDLESVLTPETQFETRYFSVHVQDGEITGINIDHIAAVARWEAAMYARQVLGEKQRRGKEFFNNRSYDYLVHDQGEGKSLVVVVDTTRLYNATATLVRFSATVGVMMIGIFFVMLSVLSRRVLSPVIANIESQRQFVTNASHELKTPIAIISANTEVLEMTSGENEWTRSIRNQTERLAGLINRLITLARLQEWGDTRLETFSASAVVKEIAESFKPLITQQNKEYQYEIDEDVSVLAEERSFQEMVSILLDNAAKYCDDNGKVSVTLTQKSRTMYLEVSNTYVKGADVDYSRFFERFYREDRSHSSEKKGYGIGLAMAEEMVKQFHGKLEVSYKNDTITFTVTI